jgi:HD-GYP domain-containing protein (c-di-GMP phosphodiesterase class II)
MKHGKQELKWVPLEPNAAFDKEPFPPREPGDITDLTSAVRIHGILSPLLLRVKSGQYQVVCGYRRYLAAKAAGLSELPALVGELDDAQAIRSYLLENIVRRPMGARAQEEALEILKRVRDRSREPGEAQGNAPPMEPMATDRLSPWIAGEEAAAGTKRVPSFSGETSEGGPTVVPGGSLDQTLERMKTFLAQVRSNRLIHVPEAELLTGAVLELNAAEATLNLGALLAGRRGALGDFTAPHSLLVALLSARVASFLQWNEERTRALVTAGLLHDIGMVFLWGPVKLDKPHALSRAERVALRSHTRIGYALIEGTRAWPEAVPLCARDHHERWDGSGYPAGRMGEDVSYEARLMGVLDAYMASISDRPHRRGLPPTTALERISESFRRGCFDPALFPVLRGALTSASLREDPSMGLAKPSEVHALGTPTS